MIGKGRKKLEAFLLAAFMAFQMVPAGAYADDDAAVSAEPVTVAESTKSETQSETQNEQQSETQNETQNTGSHDATEKPAQSETVTLTLALLVADAPDETTLRSAEDLIVLSNQSADSYQTAEIVIDLSGDTDEDTEADPANTDDSASLTEADGEGTESAESAEAVETAERAADSGNDNSSESAEDVNSAAAAEDTDGEETQAASGGSDEACFDLTSIVSHTEDDGTVSELSFQGLGSAEYPFKGKLTVKGGSGVEIAVSRSFFNSLDQSANIGDGICLMVAGDMDAALLAQNFTNLDGTADPCSVSLCITAAGSTVQSVESAENAENTESEENSENTESAESAEDTAAAQNSASSCSFGGLVGAMDAGTSLQLSVINQSGSGQTAVVGAGNTGFFCGTIGENASLTVAAYSGDTGFTVSSSGGDAGAVAGSMGAGSTLAIAPAFAFTGSVFGNGSAGGLVGYAAEGVRIIASDNCSIGGWVTALTGNAGSVVGTGTDTIVAVGEGMTVSIDGCVVTSGADCGVLFGRYICSEGQDSALDLSGFTVNRVTLCVSVADEAEESEEPEETTELEESVS